MSSEIDREIARMDYEARIAAAADRLRFQQETGLAAIKSLMLANGGAILALLTFIGNRPGNYDGASLRSAFTYFCVGLGLALLSYLGAYYSQAWFQRFEISNAWNHPNDMKREARLHDKDVREEARIGHIFLIVSLTCIAGSLGTFGFGAFAALNGLL